MAFIIIYVTNKNLEEAKKIGNHLLEKKLIACVNYSPIESAYCWNGKIETENEVVALLKTTAEKWDAVKKEIEDIHPYDVPCIMKMPVEANEAYEDWIGETN